MFYKESEGIVMNKMIRPLSDLRDHFVDISETAHRTEQLIFLTKDGYGDMVVLSNRGL
jgi:hypothetical protein